MGYLNHIKHTNESWKDIDAGFIAVGVFEDGILTDTAKEVDQALGGQITSAIDMGDIKGKSGKISRFYLDGKRIFVIGLGKKDKCNSEEIRKAGGALAKVAIALKIDNPAVECFCSYSKEDTCQPLAEGLVMGSYQFLEYQASEKDDDQFELSSFTIFGGNKDQIQKGTIIGAGVCFARDLGNHPGNVMTPTRLSGEAAKIANEGDMNLAIFEREEFTDMGMGSFAGVAQGTDEPPKFILMEYFGAEKDEKPIVLVGKGLTFDSGGISIKGAASMDEMKFDMCGSGVVLGVMKAVAGLKPKMNIIAAIPSTENMPGGKAVKPGDILTAYNGKTIEVLNTDAEGRLILADALAYVSKHYSPEYILDFATLTGAVLVALGHIATGVMGTDESLMEKVKTSSKTTDEKVWELPLWDEYLEQVKSKIADVKNMGAPRQAGTIAGAAFLNAFVGEDIPWVHFDIAGTAWGEKETPYGPKSGATGNVVRLVLDLMKV